MAEEQSGTSQASKETPKSAVMETNVVSNDGMLVNEVSLDGWSGRVEDLIDKDDEEGAINLLQGVIAKLSVSKDAKTNLGLAAALSDLGGLYASQGLSLVADKFFTDSLLIKKNVEGARRGDDISWEDIADESLSSQSGQGKQLRKAGNLPEGATGHAREHGAGTPGTAGGSDEEDWEAAVPSLLASPPVLKPVVQKPEMGRDTDLLKQKQRGRGSFTYGGGGLYSDQFEEDAAGDGRLGQANTGAGNDHWDAGAEHVLLIDGFSPMIKTKDLEDLLRPYSSQVVNIRWIDDSSVVAVFRTPVLARQALAGIRDPRFKVHKYTEAVAGPGQPISLSSTDLEPPAPRPATTARVAQRMIAGALSRQGSGQNLRAKTRASAEQSLLQEAERKQRLLNRQQLRDEAWGDD